MPALFPDEDDKTAEVKLTKEEEFAKAVEKIEADCEKYFEAEALAALNS